MKQGDYTAFGKKKDREIKEQDKKLRENKGPFQLGKWRGVRKTREFYKNINIK